MGTAHEPAFCPVHWQSGQGSMAVQPLLARYQLWCRGPLVGATFQALSCGAHPLLQCRQKPGPNRLCGEYWYHPGPCFETVLRTALAQPVGACGGPHACVRNRARRVANSRPAPHLSATSLADKAASAAAVVGANSPHCTKGSGVACAGARPKCSTALLVFFLNSGICARRGPAHRQ
jgi:hypothetical protein